MLDMPKAPRLPPEIAATITALREQRSELSDAVVNLRAAFLVKEAEVKELDRSLKAAREEINRLHQAIAMRDDRVEASSRAKPKIIDAEAHAA